MGKTIEMLKNLVIKEGVYNAKIKMPLDLLEALEYIEKNSEVESSVLIIEGLKKLNVIKIAKDLQKEKSENIPSS